HDHANPTRPRPPRRRPPHLPPPNHPPSRPRHRPRRPNPPTLERTPTPACQLRVSAVCPRGVGQPGAVYLPDEPRNRGRIRTATLPVCGELGHAADELPKADHESC